MNATLKLMCVLAHPDDETLGMGGALAKYADQGVEINLVTATRGERGRYQNGDVHPGPEKLGKIREAELRSAADELGVREVHSLDCMDGEVDRAQPGDVVSKIVYHMRRFRPHVVITFGPEGGYGHTDHIAISQFTTTAVMRAADGGFSTGENDAPHQVSKLYYMAWSEAQWDTFQSALKPLVITVDGGERRARPWADWAITTRVDAGDYWQHVWRAVQRHESQTSAYSRLAELSPEGHRHLWGRQEFYRVFSLVNGGREPETDLFEGLR